MDRTAATEKARLAAAGVVDKRINDQVDSNRELPEAERERLVARARSEYFRRVRRGERNLWESARPESDPVT